MRVVAALGLMLLLSGCLAPTGPDGDGEDGATSTTQDPINTGSQSSSSSGSAVAPPDWDWDGTWAAKASECGYCGSGAQTPMVAVDEAGQAMLVTYRRGSSDSIQFSNGTGQWRPFVQPPFELLGNGSTNGIEVVRVQVITVPADDWTELAQDIRDGLATARDPQPKGGAVVADGGYERLWADGRRVILDNQNDDGGAGWSDVADALDAVRQSFAAQG